VVYPEEFEMHSNASAWRHGRPAWVGDWAAVWDAVMTGREPAESLPSVLRAALFRTLRAEGGTDTEIAAWTRSTVHVVRRQIGQAVSTPPRTAPVSTACHARRGRVPSRS
jgi:hypothetical protein